jgi:esterase/lipase superfamily enzyme
MRRDITEWYSERLYLNMPLVVYGHAGFPILMVPTAAADYLEYERFQLIETMRPYIDAGRIRVYSINSVNRQGLMNNEASPAVKIEYVSRYDSYIVNEVLPFIRHDTGDHGALPLITGISLGAYLAANTFFKHPDQFAGGIFFSGSYDIRGYMDGYYSDTVYFNNPVDFLSNMGDGHHLDILRHGKRRIIVFTGQGAYEAPNRSRQLSDILSSKGVPHELDMWGYDVNHDWPWWRKAMPYYLGKLFS